PLGRVERIGELALVAGGPRRAVARRLFRGGPWRGGPVSPFLLCLFLPGGPVSRFLLFLFLLGGLGSAILGVPGGHHVEIAGALHQGDTGLAGLLWSGRQVRRGGVVGRHGRVVGVGQVGEARAWVRVNVARFKLPVRI